MENKKTTKTPSAKKSRPVATPGSSIGQARYRQIKEGIDWYHKAMKEGFFIEAMALMESAISDRLESTLNYLYPDADYSYSTIGRLADNLMNANYYSKDTLNEIKDWAKQRNDAIHQMVKLLPGNSKSFKERYDDLRQYADQGYDIFRKVDAKKKEMIQKTTNP